MNTTSTPPVTATQPKAGWLEKHWKGALGIAIVLFVAGIAALAAMILAEMKRSDVYAGALARATSDRAVIAALGEPVRDGFWFSGSISVSGGSGQADLVIPISGPHGRATLYAVANKSAGLWRYEKLVVQIEPGGQRIEVAEPSAPPAPVGHTTSHAR